MKSWLLCGAALLSVATFVAMVARNNLVSAQDCGGMTVDCGYQTIPCTCANGSGAFERDGINWDWYIAGDDEDIDAIYVDWDSDNSSNIEFAELTPFFVEEELEACSGTLVTTASGALDDTGTGGSCRIRGFVQYDNTQLCQNNRSFTVFHAAGCPGDPPCDL